MSRRNQYVRFGHKPAVKRVEEAGQRFGQQSARFVVRASSPKRNGRRVARPIRAQSPSAPLDNYFSQLYIYRAGPRGCILVVAVDICGDSPNGRPTLGNWTGSISQIDPSLRRRSRRLVVGPCFWGGILGVAVPFYAPLVERASYSWSWRPALAAGARVQADRP